MVETAVTRVSGGWPLFDRTQLRTRNDVKQINARSFPILAALTVAILTVGACADEAPPLPGSAPSLESLGRTVWSALVTGDTTTLTALRLTEHEHNDRVWPELPASRPEVAFPVDLAWENIQLRNRRAITRLLASFRGSRAELRTTECRGETGEFRTFHVLHDCYLVLEHPDRGRVQLQAFRYVHVMNGGYKVFRYYDD